MAQSNLPENKTKRKGLYIIILAVLGIIMYLLVQFFWILPQEKQALKMQFIEEKNWINDFAKIILEDKIYFWYEQ